MKSSFVVLVCGGREFWDGPRVYSVLDAITFMRRIDLIVHGDARGADTLAGAWAKDRGVPVRAVPADWKKHGRSAGPIRNQQMLDEYAPDLVVVFPGGNGTEDMRKRAAQAGVGVLDLRMQDT